MTETIVCQAILMKMNRAMESLVPQAYGRGELDLAGVYLNRGRLMILIASLPIMAAILHAKYLYLALHQDPKAVNVMHEYLKSYIPGMYFFIYSDIQRKFLTAMGRTAYPTICFAIATALHPLSLQFFVNDCNFGYVGIGYAGSFTNLLTLALILTASYADKEIRPALHFPDSRSLYGHWEQLKLGGPIIINAFLDWAIFQITAFTAGYLGIFEQAAQIAIMTLSYTFFELHLGLGDTASLKIGQAIGRLDVEGARRWYSIG